MSHSATPHLPCQGTSVDHCDLPCQSKIELTRIWDNFLRSSLQPTTKNFKHLIDLLMISVGRFLFGFNILSVLIDKDEMVWLE